MDVLTLLFLFAAVVIFLRLKSVLGTRTGHEKPPLLLRTTAKPLQPVSKAGDKRSPDPAPAGPEAKPSVFDSSLSTSLKFIENADPSFSADKFLKGARIAYETILAAFAKGEREVLKKLTSPEIYGHFDEDIMERTKRGETVEFHFIGLDKADIVEALLKGAVAQITVAFTAKLVQATRNAQGEVTGGDPARIAEVTDSWTFERMVHSRDPNWLLIEMHD